MDFKERILSYMREDAYRPLTDEEMAEGMKLTDEELILFWPALESLEKEAAVIKNRNDLYGLPEKMNIAVGRLSMSAKGFGFIIPDVRRTEEDTDIFVPGRQLASAMNGDRVAARVMLSSTEGHAREGEIIRIVARANQKIVGTFECSKSFGFVTPDDTKLNQDIFISRKSMGKAKTGMKVVVEITKWPDGRRNAEGVVTEILGRSGDPGVDVLSVMRQYDLQEGFPPEVQQAANAVAKKVVPAECLNRQDRRDLPIVTIDGEDAKDLDDGVYVKKRPGGGFFLGVYIADVSFYVRDNEPLDKEAAERATSVYLVDRVIPMLPKELSNGICSLNEGVDRLAMACEMEFAADGSRLSYKIMPAVIHVKRRLTYNLVNKILVDKDDEICQDNADILLLLEDMAALRAVLKSRRHQRGAIDFEVGEVKVKLDTQGHPVALLKRVGSLAESMIEECMLAANETVAEHMDKRKLPSLYRVHEQPSSEKIDKLNDLLAAFSLHINKNTDEEIEPLAVQRVLEAVKGHPEERIISTVALRSMQQARYAAESLGHFGLAARYYTHFTSPIRRYPDLMVHRLLHESLQTGGISPARQERLRGLLPEIASHASTNERSAAEAERETVDMKKIEYMAGFCGEQFSGIISGVTAFGIFVELDNGVEGLVHVSSMADDYYAYDEAHYALRGERTNKVYSLGDEVNIIVIKADVAERNLDFVLADNSHYQVGTTKEPLKLKQGRQVLKVNNGEKSLADRNKDVKNKMTGIDGRENKQPRRRKKTNQKRQEANSVQAVKKDSKISHKTSIRTKKSAGKSSWAVWPDPKPKSSADRKPKKIVKTAAAGIRTRKSGHGGDR